MGKISRHDVGQHSKNPAPVKRKRLLNFHQKGILEAGCDEAGRGCLAGPVFAAAVILPQNFYHKYLNDSKQMSLDERNTLRKYIERKAIAWAVAQVSHQEIDEINILNASFLAMHRAVDQLSVSPQSLLIDGNRFNEHRIPHHCFVKGDGRFKCIAAASVLAKTYRDEYMEKLAQEFPHYQWQQNKGYPTPVHRSAIREHGLSPWHRLSFRHLPEEEAELQI